MSKHVVILGGGDAVAAHDITGAGDIAGAETFGTPGLAPRVDPAAIASAEAVGAPSAEARVDAEAVAGAEAFGSPTLSDPNAPYSISGAGEIASGEALASPATSATVAPDGIASAEALGAPGLAAHLDAASLAGAEAFDAPTVSTPPPAHSITGAGDIFDNVNFGVPSVSIQAAAQLGGARRKRPPRPPYQWLDPTPTWPERPKYWLDINAKAAGDIESAEAFGIPAIRLGAISREACNKIAVRLAKTHALP